MTLDPHIPQSPLAQLMRVTNVLGLLSRHEHDARVQNLIDNLWLDRQRIRARMTPGALGESTFDAEQIPFGDRWDNEIPALYASHLTSHAVWPSDEMCELLERNVDMFREEFAGIDPDHYQVDARDHIAGLTDGHNWTVFPFYDGFGNLQADNARKCPRIAEFLAGMPFVGSIGCMAFFSIMNPDTHVPPHTSELNTRVRYHLGIEIPEGNLEFRIHDRRIRWEQDACIKIDDSYEHEVFQRADRRRVVFVVDLPHPELRAEEVAFLQQFMRYTTSA